jgi:hypothetical protein
MQKCSLSRVNEERDNLMSPVTYRYCALGPCANYWQVRERLHTETFHVIIQPHVNIGRVLVDESRECEHFQLVWNKDNQGIFFL